MRNIPPMKIESRLLRLVDIYKSVFTSGWSGLHSVRRHFCHEAEKLWRLAVSIGEETWGATRCSWKSSHKSLEKFSKDLWGTPGRGLLAVRAVCVLSCRKFEAITGLPNRYFTETIRWVPLEIWLLKPWYRRRSHSSFRAFRFENFTDWVTFKNGRWKIMLFSQWHRYTRIKRKIRVLPTGVEPMTFRLVLRMFYFSKHGLVNMKFPKFL